MKLLKALLSPNSTAVPSCGSTSFDQPLRWRQPNHFVIRRAELWHVRALSARWFPRGSKCSVVPCSSKCASGLLFAFMAQSAQSAPTPRGVRMKASQPGIGPSLGAFARGLLCRRRSHRCPRKWSAPRCPTAARSARWHRRCLSTTSAASRWRAPPLRFPDLRRCPGRAHVFIGVQLDGRSQRPAPASSFAILLPSAFRPTRMNRDRRRVVVRLVDRLKRRDQRGHRLAMPHGQRG